MKTIRKFSLVLLSMVLLFTLTSCDETGAVSVDTAKVEKSVLSVMNTALGTDFTNDESLRGKADYIWDKVDKKRTNLLDTIHILPRRRKRGKVLDRAHL